MFNEITPKAIKAAFEHPGEINENLVDAQQARRVLDRLVGYKISPLLWDKVRRGLSAGRVQTVALRLIVDREAEIRAFNPGGVLDYPRDSGRRRAAHLRSETYQVQGRGYRGPHAGGSRRHRRRDGKRRMESGQRHAEGEAPQRAAAVHDFETPAGRLQPPAVHGQAHHGARATAL